MDLIVLFLVLYILAAACFLMFALGGVVHPRVHLLGLGVFFWALVPLISTISKL